MDAIFVMWIVSSVIGGLVLMLVILWPPVNASTAEAVRWSGIAAAPGLLTLVEYAIRVWRGLLSDRYDTRWTFVLGSVFGVIFFVASFIDAPPASLGIKWELARVTHAIAWGCGLVLSLSMLLEI